MNEKELQQLLSLKGYASRVVRDEVQVKDCTFCGNPKYNLELNPSVGLFHCWACGARGRVDEYIKKFLGKDVTIAVNRAASPAKVIRHFPGISEVESDWAWKYLRDRGLNTVDVNIYEIGQGKSDEWVGRVVFTLRDYWSNEIIGHTGRAALTGINPKYYSHWVDGTKHITGYRSPSDVHVVCEGNFDGIRIHQAGYNAAVLGGVREATAEEWVARLRKTDKVVILLDGDAAILANKLRWRLLPIHPRVGVAPLPEGLDPGQLEVSVVQQFVMKHLV